MTPLSPLKPLEEIEESPTVLIREYESLVLELKDNVRQRIDAQKEARFWGNDHIIPIFRLKQGYLCN